MQANVVQKSRVKDSSNGIRVKAMNFQPTKKHDYETTD